ncbi:hypothetical protein [Bacteriovorax sp. Seq25_V]|uniref:hypothetical protein n=1 Tax=Bacteriovorax sp. Seq25_V TaxID=1201288 RepID=UPI00038A2D42|nr:hypothetical protein [Bacteriovorax sp. Seq25_V]EQC44784.1 hypothetical protein M900_0322 [Bacteriovorax sp. Seq25_V]
MKYLISLLFFLNVNAIDVKITKLPKLTSNLLKEICFENQLADRDIDSYNLIFSQYTSDLTFLDNLLLKSILIKSSDLKKSYKMIDQKLFDLARDRINQIPSSKIFTKTIYQSFLNDLGELLTDPEYRNFVLLYKQNQRINTNSLKTFENKIRMLTPWLRLILESTPEEFTKSINEINLSLLERIKKASGFITRTSEIKNLTKEKFIEKIDQGLEKAKEEIAGLAFEVAPAPNPNYVPPKELPQGVDDWIPVDDSIIEDGLPLTKDRLFPEPDPDYVPPKVLPKPVDKWGDQD